MANPQTALIRRAVDVFFKAGVLFACLCRPLLSQNRFSLKPPTSDEIVALKQEISRASGKEKFYKIERLLKHIKGEKGWGAIENHPEFEYYLEQAECLVEEIGDDDPYLKMRLNWMRSWYTEYNNLELA
ncbi:MAG: hypothetical protein NZ534_09205, partial [Bacteroidia bacterium]|nr:hypothetical protein [Bacteroidia bacterium]